MLLICLHSINQLENYNINNYNFKCIQYKFYAPLHLIVNSSMTTSSPSNFGQNALNQRLSLIVILIENKK